MNVALFGCTGFVGRHLVARLGPAVDRISLLQRPAATDRPVWPENARIVSGDINDVEAITETVDGCDVAIYAIAILREFPRKGVTFENLQFRCVERVISACRQAGVRRIVFFSANGVESGGTAYFNTKLLAEQALKSSGLDYTILRPSLIFGDPQGAMEIGTQLFRDMVKPPIPAVVFHSGWARSKGQFRMSPLWVGDLADAVAKIVVDGDWRNEIVAIGGPEDLTWTEMLRRVASSVDRNKWIIPMPIPMMRLAATLLDWLPFFPVTRDQLTMLAAGNVASPESMIRLLERPLRRFTPENLSYLRISE